MSEVKVLTKEETREKIIDVIKKHYEVTNDNYLDDGYIQKSTDHADDEPWEFAERFSEQLDEAFPERNRSIKVNGCDTIKDILKNNFKFN